MSLPVDRGGIPFLDMDPAERTELIQKLYKEGKMRVPGTESSDLGLLEFASPAFDILSGVLEGVGEALGGALDDLF